MPSLVRPLFDGPIDIVGDIHGEIDALRALLDALGYDAHGEHSQGRRLVFLGDLSDRGPDSPAIIEFVRTLVTRDQAQCLLGNHELNQLRRDKKHGNHWYLDPPNSAEGGEFAHSKPAPPERVPIWHDFYLSLPLALERTDLRVAHASWDSAAIATLRAVTDRSSLETFDHHEQATIAHLEQSGIAAAASEEKRAHKEALATRTARVPFLPNLARKNELSQMMNPVRVITSGPERMAGTPFWANGKWHMCDRVQWWDEYADNVPVIVGHYWRKADAASAASASAEDDGTDGVNGGKPNLFAGSRQNEWVGLQRNVFCTDFSVGGRYVERSNGATEFGTRLGAVQWPERRLVLDDGSTLPMVNMR